MAFRLLFCREIMGSVDAADAAHLFLIGGRVLPMLEAIERAGKPTRVIVFEPDPRAAAALRTSPVGRRWLDVDRLRILNGPDYVGASSCARFVDGTKPISILVHPELERQRPDEARRAVEAARRVQQDAVANADARRQFAGRYLLQTLGNRALIARESDTCALDGAFAGKPAVVVAAGPSLDATLATLAAYQDQVVIVACDTALRPLLAGGVRPHLMVGIDPGELNARHLAGVANTNGMFLAAEGSLFRTAYESFDGRTFIFKISDHEPWPWFAAAGLDRTPVRAWGSVATSAFDLTLRMGCDPIVFVGHDLAFTNDRPYCDNTVFHEEWRAYLADKPWGNIRHYEEMMMQGHPLVASPDVNGEPVNTQARLIAFRDWIVEQTAVTRDRRFINATGGGILHGARIEQMRLELALGTHAGPRFDARAILEAAHRRGLRPAPPLPVPSDEVIARWVEFTANTVDAASIRQALA